MRTLSDATVTDFRMPAATEQRDYAEDAQDATERRGEDRPRDEETEEQDDCRLSRGAKKTSADSREIQELNTRGTRHDPGGSWLSKVRCLLGTREATT
ncbi:hypothetical protein NDU88_004367 [Pleurodeles waltl]|uniref:Uncharacterized protein n=1 Tax=Pleurodeles waltl TaxID=8319 RepID=A0AAV7LL67_PLEWA|nr:hypothetical protein NDU88_004367 [Pleurodeles waltl]